MRATGEKMVVLIERGDQLKLIARGGCSHFQIETLDVEETQTTRFPAGQKFEVRESQSGGGNQNDGPFAKSKMPSPVHLLADIENLKRPVPIGADHMVVEAVRLPENIKFTRAFGESTPGFGMVIVTIFLGPSVVLVSLIHHSLFRLVHCTGSVSPPHGRCCAASACIRSWAICSPLQRCRRRNSRPRPASADGSCRGACHPLRCRIPVSWCNFPGRFWSGSILSFPPSRPR